MFLNDTDDRVFPASPRRRREAREQGYVWQSSDLASALTTGGAALLLLWIGPEAVRACGSFLVNALTPNPVLRSDQLADSLSQLPLTLLMVGYSSGVTGQRSIASAVVLVVALGVAITLVVDLDRPQDGFLEVSQQPLLDVMRSMGLPSP